MCGFNKLIDMVIEGVQHVKTSLKNRGFEGASFSNKCLITSEMLVDQAKATHSGFGFLFFSNTPISIINPSGLSDPHNPVGLHTGIQVPSPSMMHNPIESASSIGRVNHVFHDSSSIGGTNHYTTISAPTIGIGSGF